MAHAVSGPLLLALAPPRRAHRARAHPAGSEDWYVRPLPRSPQSRTGWTVVELGAGCALLSLLTSTLARPPSLVVLTDYPDAPILANLTQNLQQNVSRVSQGCTVHSRGHEWG
ncbi:uncharacterized protein C8Q71DRAFT_735814 [Rhodofomes roseus]|uniref:Uncharacterized protein n=1 Tax=Rhodofomes roseus TaxID=34475 RepID=A0ABQ8KXK2_9APHY|nr:uncharacterized protein C8Q71DRAFT_735814 [Rhodofomes roseus]KAH9843098.1 hypothetical protein C8Q71DRAFT_735814 [Rhodofomes roseus]